MSNCVNEAFCGSQGMDYANEIQSRACSVRVKRCQSSSVSLIQDVREDKMEDQVLYRDVSDKDAASSGEKGALEDGSTEDGGVGESITNFQCPKCGKGFRGYKATFRYHILSHYHKEFYKVLPCQAASHSVALSVRSFTGTGSPWSGTMHWHTRRFLR